MDGTRSDPQGEDHFRQITDHAPVMMWVTDAQGSCTYLNRCWHQFTGQAAEEGAGLGWLDAVHPEDRPRSAEAFLAANARREPFRLEYRLRRHDGAWRWAIDAASPRFAADGTFLGHVGSVLDIHERREMEDALRASEARMRFVSRLDEALRAAPDAAAAMGKAAALLARRLGASRTAYADLDADGDRFVIRSDWTAPGIASSVGAYSLDQFGPRAAADMRAGRTLVLRDVEAELAPGEGRATFLAIGVRAIICCPLVKGGALVAMMAVHQDAPRDWAAEDVALVEAAVEHCWSHVARVGAEARLRDSETRYRTLFDSIESGFCVVEVRLEPRTDYRIIEANPAFERQSGLCGAQGRWLRDFRPDLEEHWYETYARIAQSGEPERFEQGSDALDRWFDVYAFRTGAPEERRVAILFTDISERRRAEEALRQLNATLERRVAAALAERRLLADIVEATDAMVQVLNPQLCWLAINRAAADAFARAFGVRPAVGQCLPTLLSAHPAERDRLRALWARALAGEAFIEVAETPGGRFHEMRFSTLRDERGRITGAYQFVHDVTRRVTEQRRLAETEEALRQSQKMEAMGSLTGGVAHDFNNLLSPIVGSLDLLIRRGVGDARERRLVAAAMESAERARTLVQRLLAFARRQPLTPSAVDLARLVENMAALVRSTAGPQIRVAVDAPAGLPPALADPNQVEMALLNLAVNARDAMPEGGTLRIAVSAEAVAAPGRAGLRPGGYLRLSVADTGTGMEEAVLKRAVEPFFSTKGIGKGTGLGLSMVHGLASQLGGALEIRSRPGMGTDVALWLPASPDAAAAPAPEAGAAPRPAAGTALLVDDEELVRMSTAEMLADLGYAVVEADSAEAALALVQGGLRPALLVTDHLMPGMTGSELALTLRGILPGLRTLVVSGYAENDGIAPGLPRITKPFRRDELAAGLA